MPQSAKGKEVLGALTKEYGKKAKNVYFGMITKGKLKGAEPAKTESRLRSQYKSGTSKLRNLLKKFRKKK